jgi:PPOX class probable F420-dependent enzyme
MPSRRELIKMTDAEKDEFLGGRHTMNIATFGPDGNIHLVAMWYGFIDGDPAFETFAKSQKVKNLRRDPRITVLVEDGDTYDQLRGVELVGRAEIIEDPEVTVGLAKQVVQRYYGIDDDDTAAELARTVAQKRVTVRVVPDKVVTWDHRKLAGGY